MSYRRTLFVVALALFTLSIASADAQLIPVGPFTGALLETFESYPAQSTPSPLVIMDGTVTLQTSNSLGVNSVGIFGYGLGDSSTNSGSSAIAADGVNLVGIENGTGKASFNLFFTNAVNSFGGYWGAATSGESPAMISIAFFNSADQLISATQSISYIRLTGDGVMEWHGWHSAIPIARVNVRSDRSTLVGDSFRAGMSNPFLTSITQLSATQVLLAGTGISNVLYTVQANTNLTTTNWVNIGAVTGSTNGTFAYTNSSVGTIPERYYRISQP